MAVIEPAARLRESEAAQRFEPLSAGIYRLRSPLTFATVAALRSPGLRLIAAAGTELALELAEVPAIDSAGLALLIDWLAAARARSCRLSYPKPPGALLSLARLSEVEALLVPKT